MSLQALIEEKLTTELAPSHIEVINESGNHGAPLGAESHFKVRQLEAELQQYRVAPKTCSLEMSKDVT